MQPPDQHPLLKRVQHNYLLVPVELCAICLKNRFITGLQMYLLLKAISPGHLSIDRPLKLHISRLLDITERTVEYTIRKLRQRNWVGYDPPTKTYYIRSFEYLMQMEQVSSRTAIEFQVADIHLQQTQLTSMKAVAAGAVVGYCARLVK